MTSARATKARSANTVVRASGTDYGLGLQCSPTAKKTIDPKGRAKVPLELEEMELPMAPAGTPQSLSPDALGIALHVG